MPHITISYRRDDSGVITGRIFDRLVGHYGREAIFRDIDNIPPGVDFRRHIEHVFDASDIVLAIIGPRWVGPSETQNRLSNEADPVRVEIEGALRKGCALIPVLVLGATMPTVSQLPDSLKDFAYRNAVQLDAGQDFDVHMGRLIRAVDALLGVAEEAPQTVPRVAASAPTPLQSPNRRRLAIAGGIAAALVLCAMVAAAWFAGAGHVATNPPPAMASTGAPAPTTPANDPETIFWQSIATSDNPADFAEYLRQYPNGRFAGLARNRQHPPGAAPASGIAATAPVSGTAQSVTAKCGGNSDDQLLRPVRLLYQAVNTKNIDLYAAQWSDDAFYRDASTGAVRGKFEKIAERRAKFLAWEQVRLTMDNVAITERSDDGATISIVYTMTVKSYGRPSYTEANVREDYVVACGPGDRWLIHGNTDEIGQSR